MAQPSSSILDAKALTLLTALQENPVGSYQELADRVGRTRQTVSNLLGRLKQNNLFTDVRANLNLHPLGLNVVDVMAEVPLRFVRMVETFLDLHPYTLYRSRAFGRVSGLYVQFRIPPPALPHLRKSLESLKDLGLLSSYELIDDWSLHASTKPRLDFWNPETMSWGYNWGTFTQTPISDASSSAFEESGDQGWLLADLDSTDAFILYHLTKDARSKQKHLIEGLKQFNGTDLSPQRLSERWHFLSSNAVSDYDVFLDWQATGLYNTVLFKVNCTKEVSSWFYANLVNPAITPPFSTRFRSLDDGFLFYTRCPPSHLSLVTDLLWDKTERIEATLLDYKSSMSYYFDYSSLDEQGWKTSEDHVHLSPFGVVERMVQEQKSF